MAEVVSTTLETLRTLLVEEAKFLAGVSSQVEEVRAELIRIQCFLKDADKRQHKEETVRNWIREIRRLAYRIEVVLETFAIEITSRREGGIKKLMKRYICILREIATLHDVGSEILATKAAIKDLTTSLESYGVKAVTNETGENSNATNQNQQRLRQTYAHQIEEYFVGMQNDIRQLVLLITDEERSHRVVSICGMGGLGKTTLAREIYRDLEVQRCFKAFAWVCITQQYHTRTILQDILKQISSYQNKETETVIYMDETELIRELYKVLKEIKCLVVLDDVWKIKDWEYLSKAFPIAEANSKVLMTTRNRKLAEVEFAYPLDFLSEDDGWELLQKRAFANKKLKDREINPRFEVLGKEMVRKCGKLPLAISVLGGILSDKDLHEWEMVNKDVDLYLTRSENTEEGYGAAMQVMALSYDDLPYHLKPCFLHLGHFREAEDIDVVTIYLMWMAEGMVSSSHRGTEETLLDVAELYLAEMASRCMVEVKVNEFSTARRFASCRLHDLMRDFCLTYGREVEFVEVLDFRGGKDPLLDSSTNKPRRCSVYIEDSNNDDLTSMALQACEELSSLFLSNELIGSSTPYRPFPAEIHDSPKFKFLRVLKFENYKFRDGKLSEEGIRKLIYLRFFSVKDSILKELPSSIGNLQSLLALDLRLREVVGWDHITPVVPNVLWKLKRLKHLYLPSGHRAPDGQGKLRLYGLNKLETLSKFDSDQDELADVLELINLRCLHARVYAKDSLSVMINHINLYGHKLRETHLRIKCWDSNYGESQVPLKDLFECNNLHNLTIVWGKCEQQKFDFPISSKLTQMRLRWSRIKEDPAQTLGKLSNLRKLILAGNTIEIEELICNANCFPELRFLKISLLHRLKTWVVIQGAMPKLSHLEIEDCPKLEMIPDGLRFIIGLKVLKIAMPKEFNYRVRIVDGQAGQDFKSICHIPFISVQDILTGATNDK